MSATPSKRSSLPWDESLYTKADDVRVNPVPPPHRAAVGMNATQKAHRYPVRHPRGVDVINANEATHDFDTDWAPRCANCGSSPYHDSADYPCGADVPMLDWEHADAGTHNYAAAWVARPDKPEKRHPLDARPSVGIYFR